MPKRTVKRCVRQQCQKIYSENEKNKYCMCGALLQLVEVDIKNQLSSVKQQNASTSNKKTSAGPNPPNAPSKKRDESSKKAVYVEEEKQIDKQTPVIENASDYKERDEYKPLVSEEIEIGRKCDNNEPAFDGQKDSDDSRPTEEFVEDDDSTEVTTKNEQIPVDSTNSKVIKDATSDVKGYLYLLLEDDEIEYELSEVTCIGRTTEDTQADIDLTEYAGKDVSRRHAVITKEKDGFYISNVSKTHSVRIIDKDTNETAMEYGSKIRLETEVGILLSKKVFLQFVEER